MKIERQFKTFRKEAFRLELLDFYNAESEKNDYELFKKYGKIRKNRDVNFFCKAISRLTSIGKKIIRLHVVGRKLTPYLKFEILSGYLPQMEAGAEVYLLDADKYKKVVPRDILIHDFWMFDEKYIFEMRYDKDACFQKEKLINKKNSVEKYLKLKKALLKNAIPLKSWLEVNRYKLKSK